MTSLNSQKIYILGLIIAISIVAFIAGRLSVQVQAALNPPPLQLLQDIDQSTQLQKLIQQIP